MNKKLIVLGLASLLGASVAQAQLAAFKVNGETVSVADQQALYDAAVRQGRPAGAELEQLVKNTLIQQTRPLAASQES